MLKIKKIVLLRSLPFDIFKKIKSLGAGCLLILSLLFFANHRPPPTTEKTSQCDPSAKPFRGYTFIYPDVINRKAAYAPYFLEFPQLYEKFYNADIQRDENLAEWSERFCEIAKPEEVADIVYRSDKSELPALLTAAADPEHKSPLPYKFAGNPFAEVLADNGCTEAIEYLYFAKKCEPHVSGGPESNGWSIRKRDTETMQDLISEGKDRFKECRSHFFRLRYAYQLARLAHYAHEWQQTVDLYNELLPQIDRRRPSIIFYWTLGHLAGALQKLGKTEEAAYRFALIFRHCASKRATAFRSFKIKNDQQWAKTLLLCQSDGEKATLYAMRAGGTHTHAVEDMQAIYQLDPTHPTLDLLLVSDVQQLEKIMLRTPVTDRKYGLAESAIRREHAGRHLVDLQKFVRQVVKEGKNDSPKLWQAIEGYLQLLAGDQYAAENSFKKLKPTLDPDDEETNDRAILKQLEIWETLLQILRLDPSDDLAETQVTKVKSLKIFEEYEGFERFLADWVADRYAANQRPGKAFLAAYDFEKLRLNPNLAVLDDILSASEEQNKSGIEYDMVNDSNAQSVKSKILEIKAMHLFAIGEPEAALATFRQIPATDLDKMQKFAPFKFYVKDCLGCHIPDPQPMNRREIVEHLGQLEFDAKAAAATGDPNKAAENYYLIGLALFNMSWFGYDWEAFDGYRDPLNWSRLAQGPVFPFAGSPNGNRENLDLTRALASLERALSLSREPELSARAAYIAAKCQQKQWFCDPKTKYRPGSRQIPRLPDEYRHYYDLLQRRYGGTQIYELVVKECKWFAAYAR